MDLTEKQKEFILENAEKINDLIVMTRKCFEDETLDGRSKQGRLVRKFLMNSKKSLY